MPHLFQEDFVEECSYLNRGPALTAAEYGHPELHPAWRAAVPALMARLCCRLGTGSRAGLCAAARVVPRGTRARGALRFSHWPERRLCVSAVLIALDRRDGSDCPGPPDGPRAAVRARSVVCEGLFPSCSPAKDTPCMCPLLTIDMFNLQNLPCGLQMIRSHN